MFKFSFNWLKEVCKDDNLTPNELFNILNLQGFEVKSDQALENDRVITIEVKANRPDMLSHIGIAREICSFKNIESPKIEKCTIEGNSGSFPINILINDTDSCSRFSGIIINNIDNTVPTPEYIKDRLEKLGINSVNAVVDIANYVMLELGQPMHTYDIDKIGGNTLKVSKSADDASITTLGSKDSQVKKGDIVISDESKVLCVAGIIGTESSMVDSETKNILLESAVFDEVSVRLTSRRMKISTPSSFRFERGVSLESTKDIALVCAKKIAEICSGTVHDKIFDYCPEKSKEHAISLRCSRVNSLIGCSLNIEQISNFLKRYNFVCRKSGNETIEVLPPSFRLDILKEVDVIEEVARIYGYDNISPVMPITQIQYSRNITWENIDILRDIFVGLGFNEVINYSFIPKDITKFLGVQKDHFLYSELKIKNAISPMYCLMRPTFVYSLINSLSYNYSRNNTDLSLFEVGRTYFEDKSKDTGYKEVDTLGFIFSGIRLEKGFGVEKDIKYNYYDLLSYINLIFNEFGQTTKLNSENYPFFDEESGHDILNCNGEKIGFLGKIKKDKVKNIQNVKLIKDDIFYCEIYIEYLESKKKTLKFESKFPSIRRYYNLLCKKDIPSEKIVKEIKNSSDLIRSAVIKDIYVSKDIPSNTHALLYELEYCSRECTLTSEEIENIESKFLGLLGDKFDIRIKE